MPLGKILVYSVLKKGIEKVRCHKFSGIHLTSYTRWKCFQSGSLRIDQQLMQLANKEIECNRKVLERLLDIVLYLAKQNLPFRGHNESANSENKGNFFELVKLLAKYDVALATHLSSGKRNQLYLSSHIQNDFIQSIGECILKEIVSQIKYYSIMADTTTDVPLWLIQLLMFHMKINSLCAYDMLTKMVLCRNVLLLSIRFHQVQPLLCQWNQ